MPDCIAHLLDNVRVGQPKTFGSLTMFPLVVGSAAEGVTYLTLDEALATGRFRVTEVSEAGRVPELRVENGLDAYRHAALLLAAIALFGVVAAFLIRETNCRNVYVEPVPRGA